MGDPLAPPGYELGSPLAPPQNIDGLIDPIENGFDSSIQTSIDNANGIQDQLKYNQDQNDLKNDELNKELASIKDLVSDKPEPLPPPQNTFYITGDDPFAIAQEVSKILQGQIKREEQTWA